MNGTQREDLGKRPARRLPGLSGLFLDPQENRVWHNSRIRAATSAAQGLPVQISRSRTVFLQKRRRLKDLPTPSNSIPSVSLPKRI